MNIKINLFETKLEDKKLLPDIELKIIDDENKTIYSHINGLLPSKYGNKIMMVGTQSDFDAKIELEIDKKSNVICDKIFELFYLIEEVNKNGTK